MATGRFRLWRLALKSIAVLSLITVLLVFVSRLSNNYVCLQIGQNGGFNGQGVGLLDINRDVYTPDARSGGGGFGQQSPDHNYVAAVQYNLATRTQDLVLRSTSNPQSQTTLQSSFPGNGANYVRGFTRVVWSPDSKNLAYLWTDQDQNLNLSIVNVDSSGKKTVSLGRNDPSPSGTQRTMMIDGWSADSQYLSVSQQSQGNQSDSLWSVADLRQAVAEFKVGAWSPQGHLYAGLRTNTNGNDDMVIWSPEQDVDTGSGLVTGQELQLITWSSDGRYFAVQSHIACANLVYCTQRWRYDIFSSQGKLVAGALQGPTVTTPSIGPSAAWSANNQKWVYLLQSSDSSLTSQLVDWNAGDGQVQVIADNVPSSLIPQIFFTAANRRNFGGFASYFGNSQPVGKRLLIPTEHDGKVRIEVADLDGSNRVTLVDNADQIFSPQQTLYSSQQFWSLDGNLITIVWATLDGMKRQVHLTWAKADGSNHFDVSDDIQGIESVQVTRPGTPASQKWISYMAERNGIYGIEIAELDTGKHYRLYNGTQQNDSWLIAPSQNGQTIALVLQSYSTAFFNNELFLVSLDGKSSHQISTDMVGLPSWSPDGSEVAYLEQDATHTNSYVKLASVDGSAIKTLPLAANESLVFARFGRNQSVVSNWTTCS